MPASSIFLLDADTASAEAISTTLESVGYTVTVTADPADAIAKASDHQLVLLDVVDRPDDGGRGLPGDAGDTGA